MACKSPSVEDAYNDLEPALEAIRQLEQDLLEIANQEQSAFDQKVEAYATDEGIDDLTVHTSQQAVKVDFTTEFNVDHLTTVIGEALKVAAVAVNATSATALLAQPGSVDIFVSLFNSIGQALKTSSSTSGSFSFNINTVGPGFRAFTNIKSQTIEDNETFGTETITAQTVMYELAYSPKLLQKDGEWSVLVSLNKTVKMLADARVGAAELVSSGTLSVADFMDLSREYSNAIIAIENEIADRINESPESIVRKSLSKLKDDKVTTKEIEGLYSTQEAIDILKSARSKFDSNVTKELIQSVDELLQDFEDGKFG